MVRKKRYQRYIGPNSAARAKKLTSTELEAVKPRGDLVVAPETSNQKLVEAKLSPLEPFQAQMEWDDVRLAVARLYGRGFRRSQIARAMVEHLVPRNTKCRTDEQKLKQATTKLRRWEYSQDFRDLVYQHAVVELDMEIPGIMVGLAKRARRGRTDAARLALELTGRHSAKDEGSPAQVTVNLIGVARPE